MFKPIAGVLLFGMWGFTLLFGSWSFTWPSAILAWVPLYWGPDWIKRRAGSAVFCMVPDCYCYCSVGSMVYVFCQRAVLAQSGYGGAIIYRRQHAESGHRCTIRQSAG